MAKRFLAATVVGASFVLPLACGDDTSDAAPGNAAPDGSTSPGTEGGSNVRPDGPDGPDGSSSEDGGDAASSVPPVVCKGDCHYVRAGGTGQGTSWADAAASLPETLVRGHVYFVGAGQYPGYTFDDPPGAGRIRVIRATTGDHGDAPGWSDEYAKGTATFGPIVFKTADQELDGRNGLVVRGVFQGSVVRVEADKVTLRGVEIDGAFTTTNGKHTGGACTLLEVGGDDIVVDGNHLHDAADDAVSMSGHRIRFDRNHVHALHGCGTDGACGPCYNGHSDGLELYAVKDSSFDGNYVHHVKSTAPVFFGNWADELGQGPADYCQNVTMTNNIFYGPDTGFAVYFEDVTGLYFANNTVWGTHQGAYGGLAIGTHVKSLDMINNVILSVNYTHLQATYDAAEHRGDYNLFAFALGQWPTSAHDLVKVDPGFVGLPDANGPDVTAARALDFTPEAASVLKGKASTGAKLPKLDYFGATRPTPPAIGAVE